MRELGGLRDVAQFRATHTDGDRENDLIERRIRYTDC